MKYGLIAGNGRFPFLVLEGARDLGVQVVVAAIKEEAAPEIEQQSAQLEWIGVGQLNRLIRYFKREEVTHAIMAGQVKHHQIFRLNALPDLRMVRLLARRYGFPPGSAMSVRDGIASMTKALPILVLPVVIVGGIRGGVFTPTEGAAVAVACAIAIGFALRALSGRAIIDCAVRVGRSVGEILLLVAAASLLSYILVAEQIPAAIATWVLSVTNEHYAVLLLINAVLLCVGMVLDGFAAMIIFVPILLPLATVIGVDPIHFGVIITTNIMIGIITPPVGLALFITSKIAQEPFAAVARAALPFILVSILVLILITFFPALSLALPGLFK